MTNKATARTFVLCLLCVSMAGFGVQALGYAAPSIVEDWRIGAAALGPVFGAADFGLLVGALLFGMAGDKVGRRPMLVAGTLLFSVLTILTARAASVQHLLLLRFVTGIGLGGIIPNATALVSEHSARRARVPTMIVLGAGFAAGAALGGLLSASLIGAYGWRSVFYAGGMVPLILAGAMLVGLPESLPFTELRAAQRQARGVPVAHLFRDGRETVTVLLGIASFMNLLTVYSLATWLPAIVRGLGHSIVTAVVAGTVLQVGGAIGAMALAGLTLRYRLVPALAISFALACVAIMALGQPLLSVPLLLAVVFVAGWCAIGSQQGLHALAGSYYPPFVRSTGIGWGLAAGRAGAIVGPVLGAEFMRLKWSTQEMVLAAAVPALVAAIVTFSVGRFMRAEET